MKSGARDGSFLLFPGRVFSSIPSVVALDDVGSSRGKIGIKKKRKIMWGEDRIRTQKGKKRKNRFVLVWPKTREHARTLSQCEQSWFLSFSFSIFYLYFNLSDPLPWAARPPLTLAWEAMEKNTTNSILFLARLGSKEPVIVWGKGGWSEREVSTLCNNEDIAEEIWRNFLYSA